MTADAWTSTFSNLNKFPCRFLKAFFYIVFICCTISLKPLKLLSITLIGSFFFKVSDPKFPPTRNSMLISLVSHKFNHDLKISDLESQKMLTCYDRVHVMPEQIIKMHVQRCHKRMYNCMNLSQIEIK